MGMWPLIIFSGFLLLIIVTQECAGDENKPCMSWSCARKRWALQLANGQARPEILLRKLYEARRGNKEMKKSVDVDAVDGACLSWHCRRKKRAVPPPTLQQPTAEHDPACLTEDCKAGRRSTLGTRSEGDSHALMQKLRFSRESTKSDPGCIAWHCSGKKRDSIEEAGQTDGARGQFSRQEESVGNGLSNFY